MHRPKGLFVAARSRRQNKLLYGVLCLCIEAQNPSSPERPKGGSGNWGTPPPAPPTPMPSTNLAPSGIGGPPPGKNSPLTPSISGLSSSGVASYLTGIALIPALSSLGMKAGSGGEGVLDRRDVLDLMHGRGRMATDPCIPTMSGRSMSGFHRPDGGI